MKILFLTNLNNGSSQEDLLLVESLKDYFEITISHPLECERHLESVSGIIIRNIWPTYEYAKEWGHIKQKIEESGLPTYNSFNGKGDIHGKDYLVELFEKGYLVIPTVDNLENLHLLGNTEYFWIKPKEGCDGSGSGKYTKGEIKNIDLTDYVIQPYVEFVSEPSFFFVDNAFSHAIATPNRLVDKKIQVYKPTEEDLSFAQKFVEWNTLDHGIQRIDAVRTKEGELLLTEVEDLCPYLYIDDVGPETGKMFEEKIRISLLKVFY